MINYSLYKMPSVPGDPGSAKKIYANLQYTKVMSISEFAKHISTHNSVFDLPTIEGVLNKAAICVRELLLEGYKIELASLGYFYCSISSEGVDIDEEFTSDNIKALRVLWQRGKDFKTLMQDAEFKFVPTREEQEEAKRASKQKLKEEDGDTTADKDTEPGAQTGDSGSGDGDGDGEGPGE